MSALEQKLRTIGDKTVVFLTGAGISAESQIPTFRGEEGYWMVGSKNYHPTELATRQAFEQIPDQVWSWYIFRRTVCRRAQPNSGHRVISALEKQLGSRFLLVTQNVDGLHLRAGNSIDRTYEIHGNIDYMRCWRECSRELYPIPDAVGEVDRGEALRSFQKNLLVCPQCGGLARPHVLWFDECYDEEHFRFHSSLSASFSCGALISVGSSGSTNLPTQMMFGAAERGAVVVDINPEQGPFAKVAQAGGGFWLKESAGTGLARIAAALNG